ncbi:putative SP-containing protein [Vairimorpha necatrix]|uniref:SP-containing protein n=1 Tax=Vairimorpha necatrix TaxID=6039 RepID=A0AAX4JFA9_9MICR
MFSILLLYISFQLIKTSSIFLPRQLKSTDGTKQEDVKSCPIFFYNDFNEKYTKANIAKVKYIAKEVFYAIILSQSFSNVFYDTFNHKKVPYDEIRFSKYYRILIKSNGKRMHVYKRKIYNKIILIMALQTRELVYTLARINWEKSKFSLRDLRMFLELTIDVKMDRMCKWNVMQIFNPLKLRKLIYIAKRYQEYTMTFGPKNDFVIRRSQKGYESRYVRSSFIPLENTNEFDVISSTFKNLNISGIPTQPASNNVEIN